MNETPHTYNSNMPSASITPSVDSLMLMNLQFAAMKDDGPRMVQPLQLVMSKRDADFWRMEMGEIPPSEEYLDHKRACAVREAEQRAADAKALAAYRRNPTRVRFHEVRSPVAANHEPKYRWHDQAPLGEKQRVRMSQWPGLREVWHSGYSSKHVDWDWVLCRFDSGWAYTNGDFYGHFDEGEFDTKRYASPLDIPELKDELRAPFVALSPEKRMSRRAARLRAKRAARRARRA